MVAVALINFNLLLYGYPSLSCDAFSLYLKTCPKCHLSSKPEKH